jgi:hypothetical protein
VRPLEIEMPAIEVRDPTVADWSVAGVDDAA